MKRLILVTMLMPLLTSAQMQKDKGVQWTSGLTWAQVKQKAKQENKYIFMDCYATWCGPCKKMDKETYPDDQVGVLINQNFIAVKVQMDSTKDDTETVRKWYPAVKEINKNYTIPGYPTYLFFSPEGELIHQDLGYKSVKDFVDLVNDALNPSTQLATIREQYKNGKLSFISLGKVALAEKKSGRKDLADSIARNYKVEFLDKLNDEALFSKENIQFVADQFYFLMWEDGTQGRFFHYFFDYPKRVDSVFGKGFAEYRVKNIVTKEEISPKLLDGKKIVTRNPDWENLKRTIASKYGEEIAEQVVTEYQPGFYLYAENWQKWSDLFEKKIKGNPPQKDSKNLGDWSDDWVLNNNAWTAFQNCNNKAVLLRALQWSELAIKLKGSDRGIDGYLDTKANLLYKLGKRKQAIKTEKKALQLNNEIAQKEGKEKGVFFKEFSGNIQKMEAGVPTWGVNN